MVTRQLLCLQALHLLFRLEGEWKDKKASTSHTHPIFIRKRNTFPELLLADVSLNLVGQNGATEPAGKTAEMKHYLKKETKKAETYRKPSETEIGNCSWEWMREGRDWKLSWGWTNETFDVPNEPTVRQFSPAVGHNNVSSNAHENDVDPMCMCSFIVNKLHFRVGPSSTWTRKCWVHTGLLKLPLGVFAKTQVKCGTTGCLWSQRRQRLGSLSCFQS